MERTNHRAMRRQEWGRIICLIFFLNAFLCTSLVFGKETPEKTRLTDQERAWIAAHPTIRLAPDPEFRPIEYFDEKGNYVGMAADYARLIGQKLGIKFEIVRCANWDDVIARTKRREVDVLNAVVKTPQREAFLRFPSPYLKIPSVIIVKKNVERHLTLDMLKSMDIVMVSGYGYVDLVRNKYPQLKIDLVPDLKTALRKVSFGLADALVGDLATASYYIESEGITNLRVAGETEPPNISGFAVRSDWPELSLILEKGIALLTEEDQKSIYRKWIRLESEPTLTMREFRNLMLIIAGIIALMVFGFFLWNRTLRHMVRVRTEGLQKEITDRKQAEEEIQVLARFPSENPNPILRIARDGTLLYVNPAGLGQLPEWHLQMGQSAPSMLKDVVSEVMNSGSTLLLDLEHGNRIYSFTVTPIVDAGYTNLYGRDITERKKAENELRESEQRYRELTDFLPISFFEVDAAGSIISFNRTALEVFRYNEEDYKEGMNALQFFAPEEWQRVGENMGKVIQGTSTPGQEFTFLRKDGSKFIGLIYASPNIHQNKTVGIRGAIVDITDRKRAEEALESEHTLLRNLIDNVPDRIYAKDSESRFIICNEAMIRRMGKTSITEIVGKSDFDLLPLEMAQRFYADEQAIIRSGIPMINREEPLATEGGKITRWNLATKVPLLDKQGNRIGIVGVGREITDRKRAEDLLRSLSSRQEAILAAVPEIIMEVDNNKVYTWANSAGIEFFGEDVIGKEAAFYFEGEQETYDKVSPLFSGAQDIIYIESWQRRSDGEKKLLAWWCRVLKDEDGNVTGALSSARDITERKRAEKQLQDTLESLRRAVGVTIQVMVSTLETRDPYTAGHQIRSADLSRAIATEMGLPKEKIEGIRMAGSIHDIGKLSIPAEILSKPTKLSDIEFRLIKEHARRGYEILINVESPWPLAEIVYQHHERLDGSGYPRNLKGDEILLEARILGVADVVEAMASHRPYRPGLGIEAALNEIENNRGIFYDNAVADACLRLFRDKGFKLEDT
jgi:PAS domain S-box-containing protein